MPSTPYSPGGGTTAHSVLKSHTNPAQDGDHQHQYTVEIRRTEDRRSLRLEALEFSQGVLEPPFEPRILDYTLNFDAASELELPEVTLRATLVAGEARRGVTM